MTSYDIKNFDTSKVTDMGYMFSNCTELVSLNLSNFDYSSLKKMDYMLSNNNKLECVDFGKKEIREDINSLNIFNNSNKQTIIYVNKKDPENFFNEKNFSIVECGNASPQDIKNKYRENKIVCVQSCKDLKNYKFKYLNRCYITCPENTKTNTQTFICEQIEINLSTYLNKQLTTILEIKTSAIIPTIFKEIQNPPKTSIIIRTTQIETPNSPTTTIIPTIQIENQKPPKKTTIIPTTFIENLKPPKISTTVHTTPNETQMPMKTSTLIPTTSIEKPEQPKTSIMIQDKVELTTLKTEKKGTIETNLTILCDTSEFFLGKCENIYQKEEDKDSFRQNIIDDIIKGNLNDLLSSVVRENKIILIQEEEEKYQISTISGQKDLENLTSIDFGECEDLLKAKYTLNQSDELIIFKIEHTIEGINIPIIEYALFSNNGSIILDLSICENTSLKYITPVSINSNEIYKYNLSSEYYSDICKKYTFDNIDLSIYDRKYEYNEKNMSLCEYNCTYQGYDANTSKVQCKCSPKNYLTYINNTKNNNNKELLNKTTLEKSNYNLDVTQCINLLTSPDEIKTNTGFYIILIIIFLFFIVGIIFCCKGYREISHKMDVIIDKKFNVKVNKKNIKKNTRRIKNPPKKAIMNRRMRNMNKKGSNKSLNKQVDNNTVIKKKNNSATTLNTLGENNLNNNNIYDNDYELNILSFMEALKYDKRTVGDYYCSLICYKQIILYSFFNSANYTPGLIKKFCIFLSFAFHYAVNALFFNDTIMHKIYEDEGNYNILYQIPFICSSAAISTIVLRIIMETLILTEKNFLEIKRQKTKFLAENQKAKSLKCIMIKYIIFFVLCALLLVGFWIYLTCFSAVYKNTQSHLIKNTLISFAISSIYPFLINIIPVILRKDALLSARKGTTINEKGVRKSSVKVLLRDREYVYNVSKYLQLL